MTAARRFTFAASLILAAFVFLAVPAMAGCGDEDPSCRLLPPQSRQVVINSAAGEGTLGVVGTIPVLNPAQVVMPPPALFESSAAPETGASHIPSFETLELPFRRQSPEDVSCGAQALDR